MLIANMDGEREWEIWIVFNDMPGQPFPVEHFFDSTGNETFDPTEAVEVDTDEFGLKLLEAGDAITYNLITD